MKKNKTKKDKPKYGLLSNVAFSYKNIWKYDKFIVFCGLFLIPIRLIVHALSVYLPSYVTSLFNKFSNFEQIIIGIVAILLFQLIVEIIDIIITQKSEMSVLLTVTKIRYKLQEKKFNQDYFLRYTQELMQPTNSAPPAMLPRVAGIRLSITNCGMVTDAPSNMPIGMKNMLAMQCSYPSATKAITGRKQPAILPKAV